MPSFEVQPDPALLAQAKVAFENLLKLAGPLEDAPTPMDVGKFLEWCEESDATARGVLYHIGNLRMHYARFVRKKDGTLMDRDTIPGI